MKLFVTILLSFLTAHALSWSQIMSWKDEKIDPDAQYSIETSGYNIRVYEFTPLTDPERTCVIATTNEKMQMQCFDKSSKALRKER